MCYPTSKSFLTGGCVLVHGGPSRARGDQQVARTTQCGCVFVFWSSLVCGRPPRADFVDVVEHKTAAPHCGVTVIRLYMCNGRTQLCTQLCFCFLGAQAQAPRPGGGGPTDRELNLAPPWQAWQAMKHAMQPSPRFGAAHSAVSR